MSESICSQAGRQNVMLLSHTGIAWSALVAQPQKTQQVSESLNAVAIEHFIPREEITYIHNGRHRRRFRPMLGRYVLYVVNELWRSISTMRGVTALMLVYDKEDLPYPAYVDEQQVNALRALCVGDVYRPRMRAPKNEFTYGQRVMSKTGPFAFFVGRYDAPTRSGEAVLFLLFGKEQRVIFQAGELSAA